VDSFVFVDDNPAERDIIRQQVPRAGIPELEKPEKYIRAIDKAGFFEMTSFNSDDVKRNKMYKENAARIKLQSNFSNYNDYLKNLEMIAEIESFKPIYLDRISQLTNKSNQFNLTTLRCTKDEIEQMSKNNEFITLYGRLIDKFGDNGVVTVVVGKKNGEELDIVLWLMSCRVLKRDMEKAMLDELVLKAKVVGLKNIIGHYYPTAKNGMVKDFYGTQGFEKLSEDKDGNSNWRLAIKDYKPLNHVIKIQKEI
jgi:FkbH-like protein